MTRRKALTLLSAGTGLGALARVRAAVQAPSFPPGAVIRTLLKDVDPATINGPLLFHEHLSIRYPLTKALAEAQGRPVPASFSDDVDLIVEEMKLAGQDGVACLVDGGHPDMDRDLGALRRIARESGVPIVGSGGFYTQRYYPAAIASRSVDEIAEELVRESREQRLGAFGEIGQQSGLLTDDEKKVFTAVGKAQARAGLPVFTHNPYLGSRAVESAIPMDAALRQLDLLEAAGADLAHVCIGHVCCLADVKAEIPRQLAKRGVFVGFDRVTLPIVPDAQKVTTILAFLDAGYADQLLLSSDFALGSALKKNGGPGIARAVTVFGPMLTKAGVSESVLRRILVDNPRRFMTVVPRV